MTEHAQAMPGRRAVTARTAACFGHLWQRSGSRPRRLGQPYHLDRMLDRLAVSMPSGLVLDAGCGEGIDLANQAARPGRAVIGVELSDGGCRASAARTRGLPSASVVQGDLCRLPFADHTFDFIYSYGVLHHLPEPGTGVRELVRVLKPEGCLAVYLYEDFSDRHPAWQAALRGVNAVRWATTRMPPPALEVLCRLAAPLVFVLCTIPYRLARRFPGLRTLAARMPFRHATGPFSIWGDLFDRFSAPVEHRYSRAAAIGLLAAGGLGKVAAVHERGWMLVGTKPPGALAEQGAPETSGVLTHEGR